MYLDGAIDGLLKGLNEQIHSMKINIMDAALSVLLVYFLVPHFGVNGYVVAIFACEIFNCGMSLLRLINITQPEISLKKAILKPIACIVVSTTTITILFHYLSLTHITSTLNLITRIALTLAVYILLIMLLKKRDINVIKKPSSV